MPVVDDRRDPRADLPTTAVISLVCGSVLAACSAECPRADWTVRLASGVEGVVSVQSSVRRGTCTEAGEVLYRGTVTMDARAAMTPPALGPGTYAFAAQALDRSCAIVAQDCKVVEVAQGTCPDAVVNALAPTDAREPACDATACSAGVCEDPDGSVAAVDGGSVQDAGADSGNLQDAGTDGGSVQQDAGTDGGAQDAGADGADAGGACGGSGASCTTTDPCCAGLLCDARFSAMTCRPCGMTGARCSIDSPCCAGWICAPKGTCSGG